MAGGIENPILNGPYDAPSQHFELGPSGPTGTILDGRRPSESFIPVPAPRKGKSKGQQAFDLDVSGERRERNDLINEIRYQVGLWRQRGYPGVTPISRKLLQHWANPTRENRVMFCQREAAETAIFLAEVSGRQGTPDFRRRLDAENLLHNDGLPRIALKMATGTGKTVVMAMLIAWQTINKVYAPRDARYSKRFLVITPGITIRDRLRVVRPEEEVNYYRQRDLVPGDLWGALGEAEIIIANYHTFLARSAKEMQGVASNTRKILLYGKLVDPFVESPEQIVSRVLRQFGGKGKLSEIVVINDEAHHCYQNKPLDDPSGLDSEAQARNVDARVWFKGLQAVAKKVGIKTVYDLSATPYYLSGSGYAEGFIFPWVVSDFSLMDSIESGIVKVPRIPVDDDAASHLVTYLRLWDHVGTKLPKRRGRKAGTDAEWIPPDTLEGALRSLYRSYGKRFAEWKDKLEPLGEPPPVMIVVCPNTIVSKLVYDWIAGADIELDDGSARIRPGHLELLSNVDDGRWLARPRTVLIDSAQLESGEALKADFKEAAVHEIEAFKAEIRRRDPGADVDGLTDEDLLREVMNTVGKKGKLGEDVRCVVSVSMLTEGWDANTVTHILGIRAFNSQLLCEQVVGRGLRRRDYSTNEEGRFEPEYAEVYGVPFAFIPTDRVPEEPTPKRPAVEVRALPERAHLRITFPRLTGYRLELAPTPLFAAFEDSSLHVDKTTFATHTRVEGMVGLGDEHALGTAAVLRPQRVAYELAAEVLRSEHLGLEDEPIHTRFPQLVDLAKQWLAECVTYEPGCGPWMLATIAEWRHRAAERLSDGIRTIEGERDGSLRPILDRFDSVGTTDQVSFFTRKVVIDTVKSPVNRVTLDGIKGNTWEEAVTHVLEQHPGVVSYVKNDGLDFTIPYLHAGIQYDYKPDFVVRLAPREPDDDTERYLIVEVSGTRKDQDKRATKVATAEHRWCAAVNHHGGFGRWGYVEISDMRYAQSSLDAAIERLHMSALEAALAD